jgi:LmbE family N-acetylglucosaminyl deacetylase
MSKLDLQSLASSTIMIVAPHMDDEALACGGLIAKLPNKDQIHIIYATDGMKSPAPILARRDEISPDLGKIRMKESAEAMKRLGVPEQNLHFLCLPESQMRQKMPALQEMLREKIKTITPDHIFVPFRYDRHPDHLAINHAFTPDLQSGMRHGQLIEYFVYYRWRLMPKRDIRKYIKPQFLYTLDITEAAEQKRQALDCYTSQTTIFYPWQTRPVLTSSLLDEECQNPEYFLISDTSFSGTAIFSDSILWIQVVHYIEPILLRMKSWAAAYLKRMTQNRVHQSS